MTFPSVDQPSTDGPELGKPCASIDPAHAQPPPLARPSIKKAPNGTRDVHNGWEFIFFDGYWIRYYPPPPDTLANRKRLIDHLTRRTFHHTEPGIATPGSRLEIARKAYDEQSTPKLKRVNAAMLAGALFNRATDIFTTIVDLEEKGVTVSHENELMRACGKCFREALELGKQVKHHSGEEGIDELWGEPFRAFTLPMDEYYRSRYIKIAQTMASIDNIAEVLHSTLANRVEFASLGQLIAEYAVAAKHECETMKSDESIFKIWPQFVATGETLYELRASEMADRSMQCKEVLRNGEDILKAGTNLINWIARARVPMPHSTLTFIKRCNILQEEIQACDRSR